MAEKYQLSLTGAQVDDALIQLNQRTAEGWAVGTKDGAAVGSTSQFYHNNAKYYSEQAATAVSGIDASVQAAANSATAASGSATAAAASAASIGQAEQNAAASAELSESWAVGGTGTRAGEDTNNAKYWAELSASAIAGVSTFNGRSGIVVPQAGDYTAAMVGALPSDAAIPTKTSDLTNDSGYITAAANITGTAAGLSATLGVSKGGTGKTTATSNALLTGNGTSALKEVATANGALYATAVNGAAKFGTLPVAQGGTGKTSFTANQAVITGTSTTGAFTSRAITNNTAASSAIAGSTNLVTMNTLKNALNRATGVGAADTGYATYMARGVKLSALSGGAPADLLNGQICWLYG